MPERRIRTDRRRRFWWSLIYGGIRPRRRRPSRRLADARFHVRDWHGAHLWAACIGILTLNVADAFLTLRLLEAGAVEINPFMALFVGSHVALFAWLKMGLTGLSVSLMVLLSGYRFLRVLRVEIILYVILVTYVSLIVHEVGMLRQLPESSML